MADRGQYRMDDSKRIRGWIICGSDGPIPSTFRMTAEAIEPIAARRKRNGEVTTVHVAVITVQEKVNG